MFIPPASKGDNVHTARFNGQNVHIARNATFSTNLDTKRRVYLERHGSGVTRLNTALATLGRIHFTLVTIATMPPLVHNLLLQLQNLRDHERAGTMVVLATPALSLYL